MTQSFGNFASLEPRLLGLDGRSTMTGKYHEGVHGPSGLAVWVEFLVKDSRDSAHLGGDNPIGL